MNRLGHLTELSAERLAAEARTGVPDEDAPALVEARVHTQACPTCRASVMSLATPQPLPRLRVSRSRWRDAWVPLASAAVALLVVGTAREGADLRTKGRGATEAAVSVPLALELEVQAQGRPLVDGATVAAGDRLTLAVRVSAPSYVAVWGVDSRGERYAIHPGEGVAVPWAPSPEPLPVPRGIQLDALGDEETLVVMACPFAWQVDAAPDLTQDGCVVRARSFPKGP